MIKKCLNDKWYWQVNNGVQIMWVGAYYMIHIYNKQLKMTINM